MYLIYIHTYDVRSTKVRVTEAGQSNEQCLLTAAKDGIYLSQIQ